MTGGSPVGRQWLVIRKDGTPLVDWGDGLYQDISDGNFLHLSEKDISHSISNDELDQLKLVGQVLDYNDTVVDLGLLPERPVRTIE